MPGVIGRSGGARLGAGRPPKSPQERWLDGNAGKRGQAATKPSVPVPTVPVPPASGLSARETEVWQRLEPYARQALTLTPATAGDFGVLCMLEVELADAMAARRAEGWTPQGLILSREVRGLVQRLEGKRRAFRLAPMGREMVQAEAPKDEWAEFDGATAETVQ